MSRKNENGATITRDAKGLAKGGGEDPGSFYYDTKQNDDDSVDEQRDGNEDEDDDDYRFRVYGTTGFEKEPFRQSSVRKFSRRLSRQISRRRSSLVEAMPETPAGWSVLLSALGLTALGYEINLQKSLTKPPITIGQIPDGTEMASIFAKMTATPESILSRTISPSLFVGTRGQVSSIAAYLLGGPKDSEEHLRFREIVRSSQDGAQFAVDWEVPWRTADSSKPTIPADKQKAGILKGPIRQPVIIVLHGINNDSSFGYMKSLLRSFASRGWNAAGMNFRGCGGVPLTTPRAYNASYTGDLRNFVHQISARMDKDVPVFLVGNSLGANVMTKYLGEEGLSGTLPPCVAGGASLANPSQIHSDNVKFPLNVIMGLGIKRTILKNWSSFNKFNDPTFKAALRKALMSAHIANLDRAVAPTLNRNEPFYPFSSRVGYKNGEAYWLDSSSYRLIRHISVPFLNLVARNDAISSTPSKNKFSFSLLNPNVLVVETECGGHLGWQESPPDSGSFGATSWADVAAADFFDSVMQVNTERTGRAVGSHQKRSLDDIASIDMDSDLLRKLKKESLATSTKLLSKL